MHWSLKKLISLIKMIEYSIYPKNELFQMVFQLFFWVVKEGY
jgi:hypothetical protein